MRDVTARSFRADRQAKREADEATRALFGQVEGALVGMGFEKKEAEEAVITIATEIEASERTLQTMVTKAVAFLTPSPSRKRAEDGLVKMGFKRTAVIAALAQLAERIAASPISFEDLVTEALALLTRPATITKPLPVPPTATVATPHPATKSATSGTPNPSQAPPSPRALSPLPATELAPGLSSEPIRASLRLPSRSRSFPTLAMVQAHDRDRDARFRWRKSLRGSLARTNNVRSARRRWLVSQSESTTRGARHRSAPLAALASKRAHRAGPNQNADNHAERAIRARAPSPPHLHRPRSSAGGR